MREVNEKELSALKEEDWVKIGDFNTGDYWDHRKFSEAIERYSREEDDDLGDGRRFALYQKWERAMIYASEPDLDDFTDMSFERAPWESDEDYAERMQELGSFTDYDD